MYSTQPARYTVFLSSGYDVYSLYTSALWRAKPPLLSQDLYVNFAQGQTTHGREPVSPLPFRHEGEKPMLAPYGVGHTIGHNVFLILY